MKERKGIGRAANPVDGDEVVFWVYLRDGKVAAGAEGLYVGAMEFRKTGSPRFVPYRTGAEARAKGQETFAGCEVARRASMAVNALVIGRTLDDAFALDEREVIARLGDVAPDGGACVRAVVAALRNALVDLNVAALAEATVEAKRLRVK